jgi:hypothetical protein
MKFNDGLLGWGVAVASVKMFRLRGSDWKQSFRNVSTNSHIKEETRYFKKSTCQEFSLLHVVQTGSGVHPTSYIMGTGGSFPGGKAAGA